MLRLCVAGRRWSFYDYRWIPRMFQRGLSSVKFIQNKHIFAVRLCVHVLCMCHVCMYIRHVHIAHAVKVQLSQNVRCIYDYTLHTLRTHFAWLARFTISSLYRMSVL